MRLTEAQLRHTIRDLLVKELFVSPKKRKDASIVRQFLDGSGDWSSYGGDQGSTSYTPDGFGEFDDADEDLHHDESDDTDDISSNWDADELANPRLDYSRHVKTEKMR